MTNYSSYHDLIDEEFEKRKALNTAYSLRAFARDLNLSPATLSQVMSKKNGLSLDAAELISEKLKFNENKKDWFLNSVGALHSRGQKDRQKFQEKIATYKNEKITFSEIQLEYFKVIADWYHFALLELTRLHDFKNDIAWIADTLGISQETTREAILRLKNLDLIVEKDDVLVDVFTCLATPNDVPSMPIKKFHHELMKKAMERLYEDDVSNREISSTLFAFNKTDLPKAKEKIRTFRKELEQEFAVDTKKDAVYCLGIQFFELTNF